MYQKFNKVKNKQLIRKYCMTNSRCEYCESTYQLELHHICGGIYRTDELWNIIRLCHECHEKATTHNLKYGGDAPDFNMMLIRSKILKCELLESDVDRIRMARPDIDKLWFLSALRHRDTTMEEKLEWQNFLKMTL